MKQPKYVKIAEEAIKTKNVYATAKKYKITRGTVYKYLERYRANKLKE